MSRPALLLTRTEVGRYASAGDYVEAMRSAFLQLASGELRLPAVGHIEAREGAFHLKCALRTTQPQRAAVKINGNFPQNPNRHGRPAIQGFIALLDAEDGSVLALMDSIEVTARRTAAASVLAAQFLAPRGSRRLALIGCGTQARYHLDAFLTAFSIEEVSLYDVSSAACQALASRAQEQGIEARTHPTPASAARAADIIVTATPARAPLLREGDVEAGCFIAAVGADSAGKWELDPALLSRARVVPDILAQAVQMGDLQHAIAAGTMSAGDVHGELADLVSGRIEGRQSDAQIFVFDSTGTAIEDLAAAELIYERACSGAAVRVTLSA